MWLSRRVKSGSSLSLAHFGALLLILVMSASSRAVTINFDDITVIHPDPDDICWCDHELTDQYASLGLLINGGWLGESAPHPDGSLNNVLIGSDSLGLTFTGVLPLHVSMTINAAFDQSVYLSAYGIDGLLAEIQTPGWAGTEETSSPYQENYRVDFDLAEGIHHINLGAFYGLRIGAVVDDLTFTSEKTPVPEPSLLILMLTGLLGILVGCRRKPVLN